MSEEPFKEGLYEALITEEIVDKISGGDSEITEVKHSNLADSLVADFVAEKISDRLSMLDGEQKIKLANQLLEAVDSSDSLPEVGKITQLRSYFSSKYSDKSVLSRRPVTPLREMALLTNAKGEPSMSAELSAELVSADRVDIIMSFVKQSGLNLVFDQLLDLRKRNVKVRLVTTVYMGATDKSALDSLVRDLGVEVRVDLEAKDSTSCQGMANPPELWVLHGLCWEFQHEQRGTYDWS